MAKHIIKLLHQLVEIIVIIITKLRTVSLTFLFVCLFTRTFPVWSSSTSYMHNYTVQSTYSSCWRRSADRRRSNRFSKALCSGRSISVDYTHIQTYVQYALQNDMLLERFRRTLLRYFRLMSSQIRLSVCLSVVSYVSATYVEGWTCRQYFCTV